jgi:hypothetical protein
MEYNRLVQLSGERGGIFLHKYDSNSHGESGDTVNPIVTFILIVHLIGQRCRWLNAQKIAFSGGA